ncbi:hypothetical protein ACI3ER_12295 [Bacillus sp. Wb]
MKGFTPKLDNLNKTEISSKKTQSFIELGVLKHSKECECPKCNK